MNQRLPLLLTLCLLMLSGYWFYHNVESYQESHDLGWGPAAKRNPLLAAQLFLQQNNQPANIVYSHSNFSQFDDWQHSDTIFISNSSQVLSQQSLHKLIAWLEDGGHLIVAAPSVSNSDGDRLMAHFSIETVSTDYSDNDFADFFAPAGRDSSEEHAADKNDDTVDDSDATAEPDNSNATSKMLREYNAKLRQEKAAQDDGQGADGEGADGEGADISPDNTTQAPLTELNFNDDENATLRIKFNPRLALYQPFFDYEPSADDADNVNGEDQQGSAFEGWQPFYWSGDDYGVHFLQIHVEEGLLSVMSDGQIWQSGQIGEVDHGYLLQVLAGDNNRVQLFFGIQMPSLIDLLWRWGPELLSLTPLWLLAWLLYRGQRFGVIRAQAISTRRSLREHISASAHYHWRIRQPKLLLQPLLTDISRQAQRKIHRYSTLDNKQRYQQLGLLAGLSAAQISAAMVIHPRYNEEQLLKQIQYLQIIRKAL